MRVGKGVPATSVPKPGKTDVLYKIYNWEHKNFSISIRMDQANTTMMVGKSGQLDFQSNIYTGVPINKNNSDYYFEIPEGGNQ